MNGTDIGNSINQALIDALPGSLILTCKLLWPFFLPVIIIAFIKKIFQIYKKNQLKKAGMPEIDKMSGDEFELFLTALFQKMGYKTQHIGSTFNDFGADIIIEKDGIRTAVQAKCWHTLVGEKAVQEVVASMKVHNCTKAMVIANNDFSHHAMQLAKTNGVELWNRTKLANSILNQKKYTTIST